MVKFAGRAQAAGAFLVEFARRPGLKSIRSYSWLILCRVRLHIQEPVSAGGVPIRPSGRVLEEFLSIHPKASQARQSTRLFLIRPLLDTKSRVASEMI